MNDELRDVEYELYTIEEQITQYYNLFEEIKLKLSDKNNIKDQLIAKKLEIKIRMEAYDEKRRISENQNMENSEKEMRQFIVDEWEYKKKVHFDDIYRDYNFEYFEKCHIEIIKKLEKIVISEFDGTRTYDMYEQYRQKVYAVLKKELVKHWIVYCNVNIIQKMYNDMSGRSRYITDHCVLFVNVYGDCFGVDFLNVSKRDALINFLFPKNDIETKLFKKIIKKDKMDKFLMNIDLYHLITNQRKENFIDGTMTKEKIIDVNLGQIIKYCRKREKIINKKLWAHPDRDKRSADFSEDDMKIIQEGLLCEITPDISYDKTNVLKIFKDNKIIFINYQYKECERSVSIEYGGGFAPSTILQKYNQITVNIYDIYGNKYYFVVDDKGFPNNQNTTGIVDVKFHGALKKSGNSIIIQTISRLNMLKDHHISNSQFIKRRNEELEKKKELRNLKEKEEMKNWKEKKELKNLRENYIFVRKKQN